MSEKLYDPAQKIDGRANFVTLFFSVFAVFIGLFFTVGEAPLTGVKVILLNFQMFMEAINQDGPINTRQFMIITGLISGLTFEIVFLVYVYKYVELLWNPFFVRDGDKLGYDGLQIFVGSIMVATMLYPQYWFLGLFLLNVLVAMFLWSRQRSTRQIIRALEVYEFQGDMIYEGDKKSGLLAVELTARYTAIKYIFRNFIVKSGYYSVPTVIGLFLVERLESLHTPLGMFYGGIYVGASSLFAFGLVAEMIIRWRHSLPAMAKHMNINDYEYFKRLIR